MFTQALHSSLSSARWIQSTSFHPMSVRYILILSFHVGLGIQNGLLPSGFHSKTLTAFLFFPTHASYPAHLIPPWYDHPSCILWATVPVILKTLPWGKFYLMHSCPDMHTKTEHWVYTDRHPWWKGTQVWRLFKKKNLKLVHVGTESGILLTTDPACLSVLGSMFNGLHSFTQNSPWIRFNVTTCIYHWTKHHAFVCFSLHLAFTKQQNVSILWHHSFSNNYKH